MGIGDVVVHPKYGVGTIEAIEKRLDNGVTREYYVIPKPSISSRIYVPVDSADELGLRPLSTAETLGQAVGILSGEVDGATLRVTDREIHWGDPVDLALVIRGFASPRCARAGQKQQVERARRLLAEELSVVLEMSEERVSALVDGKIARATK